MDAPKKPGRKRLAETMAIPVGKQLDADKCPPILRSIDELWGCRFTSPAARTLTLTRDSPAHIAARRLTDIYDMRNEERSQPLADGSILEYIVHGEYASKETARNKGVEAPRLPRLVPVVCALAEVVRAHLLHKTVATGTVRYVDYDGDVREQVKISDRPPKQAVQHFCI